MSILGDITEFAVRKEGPGVLQRLAKNRAVQASAIAGGVVYGVSSSDVIADGSHGMMNEIIGTPDGMPGADEILLGRRLDFSDVLNPFADMIPGTMPGAGMSNMMKYGLQDGPGVVNPAIANMETAINKHEAYYDQTYDASYADGMYSARQSRRSHNLNADGDIVLGLHRMRFS